MNNGLYWDAIAESTFSFCYQNVEFSEIGTIKQDESSCEMWF